MGKLENFTISLQKPNGVYYAGERLTGTVNLRVREQIKINCIKMNVNGFAHVRWLVMALAATTQIRYRQYDILLNNI